MFVVAADQGWQRRSEEHLAVLDALGVRRGLLVVTRCDLADADLADLAREEALAHIAATSFGEVEAVMVSGTTGEGWTSCGPPGKAHRVPAQARRGR